MTCSTAATWSRTTGDSPTSRATSRRSRRLGPRARTCAATTSGRCSTTSSGSMGTTSASVSSSSTFRRSGASRSEALCGTATGSRRRTEERDAMARIDFRELTKTFPGGTRAVDALDLKITDGEFMVVVGPSGSGKTTVLRIAAGLEQATSGEIWIGDEVMNDVPPMDRNIAMVFQSYALYPHMTVYENMAFGLKLHGLRKRDIEPRVTSAATMLGIDDLLKRKPGQLSGGQRQRVAMGRAIVREPAAFLMDEPLSNLDAKLRV